MTRYRVMGMSTTATSGVGPALVEAESAQAAKEVFAIGEGTTLAKMEAAGLVVMAEEAQ